MNVKIGFVNQSGGYENRVGLTPDVAMRALKMTKGEVSFAIEKGAGESAHFTDDAYKTAGVEVVSRKDALNADVVGFISKPDAKDIAGLKKGATAVGLFDSFTDEQIGDAFKKAGVNALDINRLPRQLSMAQSMDAMTSQASVAGYKAVLLAAQEFAGFFPMLTTAAGTIKPASVLILGAGIAGLQAIGTAKRLGAVVTAFDVRPAAEEEIKSLGAKFLDLGKYGAADVAETLRAGQGEGGYARQLTADELKAQKAATDKALADFDIVITTAAVPGKKPPEFISSAGVKAMKAGSVIVDLAASTLGGNVEGSKPEETVIVGDVKVIGAPSLASSSSSAASNLLARNITDVALHFIQNGKVEINADDELAVMEITGATEKVTKKDSATSALNDKGGALNDKEEGDK